MIKTMNTRKMSDSVYDCAMRKIDEILKYYTCPDECHGACCRYSRIRIEKKEYFKIMKSVSVEQKEIIEKKTVSMPQEEGYYRAFPTGDCPMLEGSRCGIYEDRPSICKRFPFESSDSVISVKSCQLGMNVILDYLGWMVGIRACEKTFVDEVLRELLATKSSDVARLGNMVINPKSLPEFLGYLKTTTPEIRKSRCEEITKVPVLRKPEQINLRL